MGRNQQPEAGGVDHPHLGEIERHFPHSLPDYLSQRGSQLGYMCGDDIASRLHDRPILFTCDGSAVHISSPRPSRRTMLVTLPLRLNRTRVAYVRKISMPRPETDNAGAR